MGENSGRSFSLVKELRDSQQARRLERLETRRVIPFAEYFGLLEAGEEQYFATVHERIYHAIVSKGVHYITAETDPELARMYGLADGRVLPLYAAFEEFVGIADVTDELVSYFHAPLMLPGTSEEELQAPVLIGPTGAGKSRWVDRLIRLLEESGPLWRIYGCPHNDHPLSLLPRHLRPLTEDAAEERACEHLPESAVKIRRRLRELGIRVDHDICPVCRERLLKGWPEVRVPWAEAGFAKGAIPVEDFPVERAEFSKRSNTGYFEVPLTDEDDLDISPLIGKIDIAKIPLYKSESAIGVLTLDGAFNRANQGIVEFPELFKRSRRPLKILIGATQDKLVPLPGAHGNVSVNVVIVGHSNWEEYNKFRAKGARNEALMRRFVVKFFRYNLHLSEEVRLLESRIAAKRRRELFDIAPHTAEVVAALAVLSRYKPVNEITLGQKLDVLDGKRIASDKSRELRAEDVRHADDGLEEAISFREEMKLFGRLFHQKRVQACALVHAANDPKIPIMPEDALELLPQMIEDVCRAQSFSDDRKNAMLECMQIVRARYHQQLLDGFRQILMPNLGDRTNDVFLRYVQQCDCWVTWKTQGTKPFEPDEDFLSWVEKSVHGGVRNVKEFRRTRMELYWKEDARVGKVTYKDLGEQLQQAFEECAFRDLLRYLRVLRSSDTMNDADRQEYAKVLESLRSVGYTEFTAPKILDYFLNHIILS